MVTLPNVLVMLDPRPSPAFSGWAAGTPGGLAAWLSQISIRAASRPAVTFTAVVVVAAVAIWQASGIRFDRSQVENFDRHSPIRVADELINRRFAGTSFLDVIVTSRSIGGLYNASAMAKIASLQAFAESQRNVRYSVAITDYLSLLHKALNHDGTARWKRPLPASDDAVGQYLLVYEASGDPSDFDEEIDPSGSQALVRIILNTPHFSQTQEAVLAIDGYLQEHFAAGPLTAELGGNVNLTYHWMSQLRSSHFASVGLSLALVLVAATLLFRSVIAGVLAILPVALTILVVYAVMSATGTYLEPATSMFAAISVGLGVDFAIHLISRIQTALDKHAGNLFLALHAALPSTNRACFVNAMALGVGTSVLMLSELPVLIRFGGMVAIAAIASFWIALIVIPAGFVLLARIAGRPAHPPTRTALAALCLFGPLFLMSSGESFAQSIASAEDVAQQVMNRPEGAAARRWVRMTLTNRRGASKQREAVIFRRRHPDGRRDTRITYAQPNAVRYTTFLSHDVQPGPDQRWLYIPAARKVRRVPASDRGDYFLGTDFTYEDVQSQLKFSLEDYRFTWLREPHDPTQNAFELIATPRTVEIANELGYGRVEAIVERETWLPMEIRFFDVAEEPLKHLDVRERALVEGIWTATDIHVVNHQSGHSTRFEYLAVSYPEDIEEGLFEAGRLKRKLGLDDLEP